MRRKSKEAEPVLQPTKVKPARALGVAAIVSKGIDPEFRFFSGVLFVKLERGMFHQEDPKCLELLSEKYEHAGQMPRVKKSHVSDLKN